MDQAQEQSQPSIKDRIGSLLAPKPEDVQQPQEAPEEAPEVEAGTEEAPQVTETQEEVPETDPTADWKEVELDGEKLHVPPKFEKAFLQERDYTQKTQAIAEQRRLVEQRAQAIQAQEQALQHLTPLYAHGQALQNTIAQYEKLDWDTLRANDPVDYSTKRADYAALLQQRQDLGRQIEHAHGQLNQQRQVAMVQAVQAALPQIKKSIPDWGPEKDQQLTRFAIAQGANPEELMGLASRPWAVVLLEQARKYQELQAKHAQLPKKASPSPVAKPGAKPTAQSSEGALYRKNLDQFRKGGGKDKNTLRALIKAKLGT
jgi:hypothetical protein